MRWGAVCVFVVAVGYLMALLLPAGQLALVDDRTPDTLGELPVKVLVIIPLRTVLLEEIAFRGVVWGLVRRARSPVSATAWSSALFGLWHAPSALIVVDSNHALSEVARESAWVVIASVVGVVVFTAGAGVVFAELRRRSGSLLAPMGLHWATNAVGATASFVADVSR